MIRSFLGTSLIEYPGRISSVVFLGGCNLHCPFCHNPELVRPDLLADQFTIPEDEVLAMLRERAGFIDGVSVTGGEPLVHDGIGRLLARIAEETGLPLKLDTNGTRPSVLGQVLPLLDYVALDIKASPTRYMEATGGRAGFDEVLESARMLLGRTGCEFRTTMVPGLVTAGDLVEAITAIGGAGRFVLQRFRPGKTLSPEYSGLPSYPLEYLEETAERIRPCVDEVLIRA